MEAREASDRITYSLMTPPLLRASAAPEASASLSNGPRYTRCLRPAPGTSSALVNDGTPWPMSLETSVWAAAPLSTLMTWTTWDWAKAAEAWNRNIKTSAGKRRSAEFL